MKSLTETELVNAAKAADERAFREIFRRYGDFAARVVLKVMGPSSELEDIVQDVFVQVFRSIDSFRGESKFTTWLYRLASNVTRMHLRKKRSRIRHVETSMEDPHLMLVDPGPSASSGLERREEIAALYRLVHRLSDKKRDVILMHDFQGMSASDISDELDIPVMTVRTRLFYARKELFASLAMEPALSARMDQGTTSKSSASGASSPSRKKSRTNAKPAAAGAPRDSAAPAATRRKHR